MVTEVATMFLAKVITACGMLCVLTGVAANVTASGAATRPVARRSAHPARDPAPCPLAQARTDPARQSVAAGRHGPPLAGSTCQSRVTPSSCDLPDRGGSGDLDSCDLDSCDDSDDEARVGDAGPEYSCSHVPPLRHSLLIHYPLERRHRSRPPMLIAEAPSGPDLPPDLPPPRVS